MTWLEIEATIEVAVSDPGLAGSFYTGRVVKLAGSVALIEYDEFFDDEAGLRRLQEWIRLPHLRPRPPPTPIHFFRCALRVVPYQAGEFALQVQWSQPCRRLQPVGAPLQLLHAGGWWDAVLVQKRRVHSEDEHEELLLRSSVCHPYFAPTPA
jgi:hypothetical protein